VPSHTHDDTLKHTTIYEKKLFQTALRRVRYKKDGWSNEVKKRLIAKIMIFILTDYCIKVNFAFWQGSQVILILF